MANRGARDDIGATYDACLDRGIRITSTIGRHTNDRTTSFYIQAPSDLHVEYGHGDRLIDDEHWEVQLHRSKTLGPPRPPNGPLSGSA